MRIEVWSDFVCPFCYIGKRRLEQSLEQLSAEQPIDIVYKSFELDPQAIKNTGQTIHEKLAAKYGKSLDEAKEMTANMTQQAEEVGLDFQFDQMISTNTFDAHRLAKFAETKGFGKEVAERFFHAVFTEAKDVGDHTTLVELASEIGLDKEEIRKVLASEEYSKEVRTEEAEAQEIGVQGVPFFVVNRKYAISGAQPTEVFVQSLQKVLDEEKSTPAFESLSPEDNGASCTDDNCDVPEK
ncbi:DsbA family oxidoreductase [Halobacillus seohaensis]|uniref:DsbA family oxidoreductase n=1 Tax=Halobacillus seohaensis TaxID=447421 RepID=A0ABW2EKQ5_9BACI